MYPNQPPAPGYNGSPAVPTAKTAALTEKWQAQYPQFPKDRILGRVRPNGHEGMFADYLLREGLWALTMETPWCMPEIGQTQYDAPTIRCALEVLVNTLTAIVGSLR